MSRTFLALLLCGGAALITACEEKKTETPAPTAAPPAAAPAAPTEAPPAAAPQAAGGAAAGGAPAAAAGMGTIKGSVAFTGQAPAPMPINRAADPFCAKTKMNAEDVLVNKNGTLKNVLVRLTNVTGTFEAPKDVAVVAQENCMYRPRLQGVVAGQTVQVKNGDQTLHNVHTYRGSATLKNQAQIAGSPAVDMKFTDAGAVIKFKCDVHPWMAGYVSVTNHPFFSITGDDGSFELKNVPAGTYKIEAWHEKFGTKMMDVTVAANGTAETKFSYDGTEKP
ncbi:MAG TPA: carboxypeptidase regulatory-like domain-containing protein [Polyangia bacterium]|jgi:plastocyanin|nr:carboxypeptidase regulatory-like domain-containing protein [Polyangia bacterium]